MKRLTAALVLVTAPLGIASAQDSIASDATTPTPIARPVPADLRDSNSRDDQPPLAPQQVNTTDARRSAEQQSAEQHRDDATILDTVQVVGQRLFPYQEGMVLRERDINEQIRGNSDIGTLLRLNPNIQFDDTASTSNNMGEIRPADISINGGLPYQNSFLVDGVSFNNDLNPSGSDPVVDTVDVPSYSQGIALDPEQLSSLTVFDSNVPAAYGSFNGGVVQAESRRARDQLSGKASFRTTRSVWNAAHIAEDDREDFETSSDTEFQPEYDRYKASIALEGRTEAGLGLSGTLVRTRSVIPLNTYEGEALSGTTNIRQDQTRQNTSSTLRLDWQGDGIDLSANLLHAPSDDRYFIKNSKNGAFDLRRGGPVASVRAKLQVGAWAMRNTLSYSKLDSSRRALGSIDYFKNWNWARDFDWGHRGSAQEGSWGNVDQQSRDIGYQVQFDREPFAWGGSEHRLQLGAGMLSRKANYTRLNDHMVWMAPQPTDTCTDTSGNIDTNGCSLAPVLPWERNVAGRGQYFSVRNTYQAGSFYARALEWHVYAQDDIGIGRVSLRPGVRIDGDDIVGKTTIAPRFAFAWDMLGNQSSVLTAGANRYYGRSFFNFLLRQGRERLLISQERGDDLIWSSPKRARSNYRTSDLEVPYNDEAMAGFTQRLGQLDASLKFVAREGRDEVVRTRRPNQGDGEEFSPLIYQYDNLGRSRSRTWTASVSTRRPWQLGPTATTVQLALDRTEVRRNYANYDSRFDQEDFNAYVRYEGDLIRAYQLPAENFNRDWAARLATQTHWQSAGLLWSNFMRYRAGYNRPRIVGTEDYQGENIEVLEDVAYPDAFTVDSALEWRLPLSQQQMAWLRVEAQNLFNRALLIQEDASKTYYEPGRSYWLEIGYRF